MSSFSSSDGLNIIIKKKMLSSKQDNDNGLRHMYRTFDNRNNRAPPHAKLHMILNDVKLCMYIRF